MSIFSRSFITENQQKNEVLAELPDVDTSNVSDNVEEAVSDIILSSERNWSMLMKTVGIAELTAMEADGDVIYEAVDVKAFFTKIKDFFKNILDKIAALFKKLVEVVQDWYSDIKKSFNDKKFKDLTSVPDGFKYQGYIFSDDLTKPFSKDLETCINTIDLISDSYLEKEFSVDSFVKDPKAFKDSVNKWLNKVNSQETKDMIITKIRSYLLDEKLSGDYDWNREIFKHFRKGKDKPEEITANRIDIAKYKSEINNSLPSVKRSVKESYNRAQKDVDNYLKVIDQTIYAYKSEDIDNEQGFLDVLVTLKRIGVKYTQEYLNAATAICAGQVRALADQSKQYYSALVKMLSVNASKNKDNVSESFGFTHNLLDNINFV